MNSPGSLYQDKEPEAVDARLNPMTVSFMALNSRMERDLSKVSRIRKRKTSELRQSTTSSSLHVDISWIKLFIDMDSLSIGVQTWVRFDTADRSARQKRACEEAHLELTRLGS